MHDVVTKSYLDQEVNAAKKQTKIWQIITASLVVIIFVGLVASRWTRDGLYTVYACKDNCYLLKADVYSCGGGACVDRLYFNNGGSIKMKCVAGKENECNDYSDGLGDKWAIKLIERDGDRRSKDIFYAD